MGLFSKNKYLGVDIGTASLKAVELENVGGKAKLSTYGLTKLPNDIIRSSSDQVIDSLAEALRQIVDKANISTRKAITALPGFAVFTFTFDLPVMPEKDIDQAVRYEAEKYVPRDITEMIIEWEKVEETKDQSGNTKNKILLTAAPRNLIDRYVQIFSKAGLKLESLETEAFALTRSLVGTDKSPVLIIDMGATATDVEIIDNGTPILTRSINFGGNAITQSIATSLNISFERAEQFKKDFGLSQKQMEGQIPQAVRPVVERIVKEIKQTFKLFYNKGGRRIEKVILTGGSAKLPDFDKFLKKLLGINVYIGNPWARVVYPEELGEMVMDIGPDFAVAVGLAMRDIYKK